MHSPCKGPEVAVTCVPRPVQRPVQAECRADEDQEVLTGQRETEGRLRPLGLCALGSLADGGGWGG